MSADTIGDISNRIKSNNFFMLVLPSATTISLIDRCISVRVSVQHNRRGICKHLVMLTLCLTIKTIKSNHRELQRLY